MMRNLNLIAIVPVALLCLAAATGPAFANNPRDEAAIRTAWLSYQDHIIARNGKAGAALMAKPTIKYYAQIRQLVLRGSREVVAKTTMLTRLTVYMVRHILPAAQVQSMSPRQFVGYLIARGMTGRTPKRTRPLTGVKINGDRADGVIGPGAPPLRFLRENGAWKIDLASLIKKIEPLMEAQIKKAKIPEERMVQLMVRRFSKKPIDFEKLKEPLLKP